MIKTLSVILAAVQVFLFTCFKTFNNVQSIGVNKYEAYQTFESFGTSSAWWAQTIDDDETAKEIARLLYDDETGLGLDVFRYNVGAGEKDNPDSRIGDVNRRAESFYVYNPETGEYEYDFTRDANARRMLDYAIEYGATQVVLFANSPHYSFTESGHASGSFKNLTCNLPEENYDDYVDYMLTIADWFVEQGYPVTAISPVNEPQWTWGGAWVGQEGCHYEPHQVAELFELFALEMQKRNSPYILSGPESGQLTEDYYRYIDEYFANPVINDYCGYLSVHSYWIDNRIDVKSAFGQKMLEQYPDKKVEMTEWCELPQHIDPKTIESGMYMANIIAQDLKYLNAVSWQSWTAVNGDGLLDRKGEELITYNHYYAFMQFTKFIKPGMQRIQVLDSKEGSSQIESVAFTDGKQTVIVLINNAQEDTKVDLFGLYKSMSLWQTDADSDCEQVYSGRYDNDLTLPSQSITTVVLESLI